MEIFFEKGIPGFEHLRYFKLENMKQHEDFKILSSNEEKISFVTITPFNIYKDYEIDLTKECVGELDIKEPTDVLLLNIVTVGETIEKSTANLKAPIIINIKNNQAKQIILQSDKYNTKHPLVWSDRYVSNY